MFAYDMKTHVEWDGTKYVTKYEFIFFFKTKEEYLKQREGWRKEYKELSRRLHDIKLEVKDLQRTGKGVELSKRQGTLSVLKEKARMMMECKMQSKMESIKQKELQRKVA